MYNFLCIAVDNLLQDFSSFQPSFVLKALRHLRILSFLYDTITNERKYQFFQNIELASDGIAIIRFDNPAKKMNTISFALQTEFELFWDAEIHSNDSVRAVVFASGKPNGFIAEANIFDTIERELGRYYPVY